MICLLFLTVVYALFTIPQPLSRLRLQLVSGADRQGVKSHSYRSLDSSSPPSVPVSPGARSNSAFFSVIDSFQLRRFIFGGTGVDDAGEFGLLASLFELLVIPDSHTATISYEWKWRGGHDLTSTLREAVGRYDTTSPTRPPRPGAREGSCVFSPSSSTPDTLVSSSTTSSILLFGGMGIGLSQPQPKRTQITIGAMSDWWLYSSKNDLFTPLSLPHFDQQPDFEYVDVRPYHMLPNPRPGGRANAACWNWGKGNGNSEVSNSAELMRVFLFGGYGPDSSGRLGFLSDLFEGKMSSDNVITFASLVGSNEVDSKGSVHSSSSSSSCLSSSLSTSLSTSIVTNNGPIHPSGRFMAVVWIHNNESVLLYGGYGVATSSPSDSDSSYGYLSDLWAFGRLSLEWTFLGGSLMLDDVAKSEFPPPVASPAAFFTLRDFDSSSSSHVFLGGRGSGGEYLTVAWNLIVLERGERVLSEGYSSLSPCVSNENDNRLFEWNTIDIDVVIESSGSSSLLFPSLQLRSSSFFPLTIGSVNKRWLLFGGKGKDVYGTNGPLDRLYRVDLEIGTDRIDFDCDVHCPEERGVCVDEEFCVCHEGYVGEFCEDPICYGRVLESACSFPNGSCVEIDVCFCEEGFYGAACEFFSPDLVDKDKDTLTSGFTAADYIVTCIVILIVVGMLSLLGGMLLISLIRARKMSNANSQQDDDALAEEIEGMEVDEQGERMVVVDKKKKKKTLEDMLDGEEENLFGQLPNSSITVGKRIFGVCWEGEYVKNPVAIKILTRDSFRTSEQFLEMVRLLSETRFPSILRFVGWVRLDRLRLGLVREICSLGSIRDFLSSMCIGSVVGRFKSFISPPERIELLEAVANALQFLHVQIGVTHGNLKSSNVLIRDDRSVALADFHLHHYLLHSDSCNARTPQARHRRLWLAPPLSAAAAPSSTSTAPRCFDNSTAKLSDSFRFSLEFSAPEVLSGLQAPSSESDVYSFGILAWKVFQNRFNEAEADDSFCPDFIWGIDVKNRIGFSLPSVAKREPTGNGILLLEDDLSSSSSEGEEEVVMEPLLSGNETPEQNSRDLVREKICNDAMFRPQFDSDFVEENGFLASFVRLCWDADVARRPKIPDILKFLDYQKKSLMASASSEIVVGVVEGEE